LLDVQQSNVIFGILLIAYVIFITMKGRLPVYLTLLRGGGQQPAATSSSSPIQSATESFLGSFADSFGISSGLAGDVTDDNSFAQPGSYGPDLNDLLNAYSGTP